MKHSPITKGKEGWRGKKDMFMHSEGEEGGSAKNHQLSF
jgi:hypothetical protein